MIIIRFADDASKMNALGWLPGRYPFTSWSNGEMMVPEPALGHLAAEGIQFTVQGRATYEHFKPGYAPVSDSTSEDVQRRPTGAG